MVDFSINVLFVCLFASFGAWTLAFLMVLRGFDATAILLVLCGGLEADGTLKSGILMINIWAPKPDVRLVARTLCAQARQSSQQVEQVSTILGPCYCSGENRGTWFSPTDLYPRFVQSSIHNLKKCQTTCLCMSFGRGCEPRSAP